MKYIQVDDLLTPSYLARLYKLTSGMNGFPWFFLSEDISYSTTDVHFGDEQIVGIPDDQKTLGFTHVLLDQEGVESPYLPMFQPTRVHIGATARIQRRMSRIGAFGRGGSLKHIL